MKNLNIWVVLLLAIFVLGGCESTGKQSDLKSPASNPPALSEAELDKLDDLALNDGKEVVARYTQVDKIGLSPNAAVWDSAPSTTVNLTSQRITVPEGGGSITTVSVQAIHNGNQVAFKLNWPDPTRDVENGLDTFRDAVAIAFPITLSEDAPDPFMGDEDDPVNIWQWRSDWQADKDGNRNLSKRQPLADGVYQNKLDKQYTHKMFPAKVKTAPVIEYAAAGFGSLTKQKSQDVVGQGVYEKGAWSVVFVREIKRMEEGDAIFVPGKKTRINFAVWNGSENEVSGKKSVSMDWLSLSIDEMQ